MPYDCSPFCQPPRTRGRRTGEHLGKRGYRLRPPREMQYNTVVQMIWGRGWVIGILAIKRTRHCVLAYTNCTLLLFSILSVVYSTLLQYRRTWSRLLSEQPIRRSQQPHGTDYSFLLDTERGYCTLYCKITTATAPSLSWLLSLSVQCMNDNKAKKERRRSK